MSDRAYRGYGFAQVKDEEGRLMNDFTGRIKRDEWKPPSGEAFVLATPCAFRDD